MVVEVKVKVKVYSLISCIYFTPSSLDLFIRVPSQPHGEHTVLQPFRRIELIIHIAIYVLPGTHFHLSQVKHLRAKCLAQGHNIETMSQYWEWRNMIILWKSCTKRDSKSHGRQRHWQSPALYPLRHVPLLVVSSHHPRKVLLTLSSMTIAIIRILDIHPISQWYKLHNRICPR